MEWTKGRVWPVLAVGLVVAVCGAVWLASSATATGDHRIAASAFPKDDPVVIDTNPLRTDAEYLASERGIPVDDAERYLQLQFELGEFAQELEAAFHSDIAGIWIDWRPEPVLVVRLVNEDARDSIEALSSDLDAHVDVIVVEDGLTRDELIDVLTSVTADLGLDGFERIASYLDETTSELVVQVPSALYDIDMVAARVDELAALHQVTIRIESTDGWAELAH